MDPAFLLPQQPAPVFGRTTNFEYKKVLSDPTWNPNSPAGRHTFRWQNQAGEWWVPSQSYLRIRLAFLVCNGPNSFRPVTAADGVAPVMNLPAHLFSRMEYYMDNHKLSDLQDHIPQIDTMKNRLSKSKAWFSSVGARSCFWDPNFANRQKQICPDYQSRATGVVQGGKLVSERVVVLNGQPVNLKGQTFSISATEVSSEYKRLLGQVLQRELGYGTDHNQASLNAADFNARGSPHETASALTEAAWCAEEFKVSPRWTRGRSGHYTYYCVSTGINAAEVNWLLHLANTGGAPGQQNPAPRNQDTTELCNPALRIFSNQMVGNHARPNERQAAMIAWIDQIALKKRMAFLHGLPDTADPTTRPASHRDGTLLSTTPSTVHIPNGIERGAQAEATHRLRYRPTRNEVAYGMNIINESLLADGIDVILEQEFNDGQVRSEVVTWLPKLDIFVRKDSSLANVSGQIRPGADANAHFTSWDTCTQSLNNMPNNDANVNPDRLIGKTFDNILETDSFGYTRYPRLNLYGGDYNKDEEGKEDGTTAPKYVKNVFIRPLSPSEDLLPSTRQEIIWKPPLGIFDVAHNLPTTTHELHMVIPNDYQTRCFDFGRQNLDATALGSGSGGRIMPFGLGATPGAENKGQVYLRIEGFELYCGMAMGPRADEAKFVLDMREYRMTPYSIPEQQTGLPNTYPFNLSPTTASVCVAFQSAKAGNGTCSLSKFVVPTQYTPRGAETALDRFYVTFANQNRPREENESQLSYRGYSETEMGTQYNTVDQGVQYFTQRYMETMINAGQLFRPGGCESFEEWLERGAYYNWVWPRDGGDLSTRFHVNVAFKPVGENRDADNIKEVAKQLLRRAWPRQLLRGKPGQEALLINDINILVFDMVPKAFSLSITNGKVTGAETTAAMINDAARKMLRVTGPAPAA